MFMITFKYKFTFRKMRVHGIHSLRIMVKNICPISVVLRVLVKTFIKARYPNYKYNHSKYTH